VKKKRKGGIPKNIIFYVNHRCPRGKKEGRVDPREERKKGTLGKSNSKKKLVFHFLREGERGFEKGRKKRKRGTPVEWLRRSTKKGGSALNYPSFIREKE